MKKEGQSTAEFLVVLAAVGVISVVIAVAIFGSRDVADIKYKESKVYWSRASPVAVLEAKAVQSGLVLIVKNIGKERLFLESISIRDRLLGIENNSNFTPRVMLDVGQERKISAPATYKSAGAFCELGLAFGYLASGIGNEERGRQDLIFQCNPTCSEYGEYCTDETECCAGLCPQDTHLCACGRFGEACTNSSQCCNGNCGQYGAFRSIACCNLENQSCGSSSDCCLGLECSEEGSCFYPVPNLRAEAMGLNTTMRYGSSQDITIRTWNPGTGPSMNVSTTRVVWDGLEIGAFAIPSLMPGEEDLRYAVISCPTGGVKELVVTADWGGTVGESNEGDNNATYLVACGCPACQYTTKVDYLDMNIGERVAHRAFDLNITTSDAFLEALWFDNVLLRDYGPAYLNGRWVFYDSEPGPWPEIGNCGNDPHYGPFYADPALIDPDFNSVNDLHFDIVDYCYGQVGFGLDIGFNVSIVPQPGQLCTCPPTSEGIVNVSDLFFAQTCNVPREFSTECPSGVCGWNEPQAPGACTICSTFPSACDNNEDCCSGRCESYSGTMRCAYAPVNRNGQCDVNYTSPSPPGSICVPNCNAQNPCPSPLQCVGGSCLLPCSPDGNPNPACGTFTTRCRNGYCTYP